MSASYDIFFSYRRHDPVRNVEKQRDVAAPSELFTADVNNLLNDPKIRIVVELMGGIETLLAFIKDAIRARKTVVTGNKPCSQSMDRKSFAARRWMSSLKCGLQGPPSSTASWGGKSLRSANRSRRLTGPNNTWQQKRGLRYCNRIKARNRLCDLSPWD